MAWRSLSATALHSAGGQPGASLLNWLHRAFVHIWSSHSLALAVIAASLIVYVVLLPVTAGLAGLGRRQIARQSAMARLEGEVRSTLAPDSAVAAEERRRLRRPTWRGWLAWGLRLVPVVVQYGVFVALYYAIRDEGRRVPTSDRALAGIADISRSAFDVCCTTSPAGQRTVHGHFLHGVLEHPGAFGLPLLAAALALISLWRTLPSPRTAQSSIERHTRRARRHASLLLPIGVLLTAAVLPLAVGLVWIVLESMNLVAPWVAENVAGRRARRRATRSRRLASARAAGALAGVSS